MIYLASVYSYQADKKLMQKRFEFVESYVANCSELLFSPIVYTHDMAKKYDLPKNYEFWKSRDRRFIDSCDEVWVLCMPHWRDSVGVTDEIDYALSTGKEVTLIPTDRIYQE